MLTATQRRNLEALAREGSFTLRQAGDTTYGEATGHRARRLSCQGQLTPAGLYLQAQRGVSFPRNALDRTMRTTFRGNSEYALTQDGRQVRLRTPRGELTARGRELYTQPEITFEVPAWQRGGGNLGEFEPETTRVYTEAESPEIGAWFRAYDNGRNDLEPPGLLNVKRQLRAQFQEDDDLLAQESDRTWGYREGGVWVFRVRRRVGNELAVFRIPLRHGAPLRYDFMTKLRNVLPEALEAVSYTHLTLPTSDQV